MRQWGEGQEGEEKTDTVSHRRAWRRNPKNDYSDWTNELISNQKLLTSFHAVRQFRIKGIEENKQGTNLSSTNVRKNQSTHLSPQSF